MNTAKPDPEVIVELDGRKIATCDAQDVFEITCSFHKDITCKDV